MEIKMQAASPIRAFGLHINEKRQTTDRNSLKQLHPACTYVLMRKDKHNKKAHNCGRIYCFFIACLS